MKLAVIYDHHFDLGDAVSVEEVKELYMRAGYDRDGIIFNQEWRLIYNVVDGDCLPRVDDEVETLFGRCVVTSSVAYLCPKNMYIEEQNDLHGDAHLFMNRIEVRDL